MRAIMWTIVPFLCLAFAPPPAEHSSDQTSAEKIKSLEAERERLLRRLAEVDGELARLKGNKNLPKPLEGISYDVNAVEKDFTILGLQIHKPGKFRDMDGDVLVWTLKAKQDLTGGQIKGFESDKKKAIFYKDVQGSPTEVHRTLFRIDDAYTGVKSVQRGEVIEAWLPLGKPGTLNKLAASGATRLVFKPE